MADILFRDDHYGICCCHKGRMFLGNPDTNVITFSALYDYDNFDQPPTYQLVSNPLSLGSDADKSVIYLTDYTEFKYQQYIYEEGTGWEPSGEIYKTEITLDSTGRSMPDYSVIAGDFKVTNADGRIVALKSFDDKLVIFCEHSMHVMYGDTPDTTASNQFQLVDLNNNLGAISDRCIAIGGGRLFFLGDNQEVYEYTGSELYMISRPGKTRNATISVGGVSGVIEARDWLDGYPVDMDYSHSKFICTSEKLFINIWNRKRADNEKLLFVFDIYTRTWWCEDGEFQTIGDFSFEKNRILLGLKNGDILINNTDLETAYFVDRTDKVYDFSQNKVVDLPINYEFHTRVYGADGTDLRESLSNIWLQARANAKAYVNDIWTSLDVWSVPLELTSNLVEIGKLEREYQPPTQAVHYRPDKYEQQVCYVPKMYEQRVNTFQVVVKGTGSSIFYLMKRNWRAR